MKQPFFFFVVVQLTHPESEKSDIEYEAYTTNLITSFLAKWGCQSVVSIGLSSPSSTAEVKRMFVSDVDGKDFMVELKVDLASKKQVIQKIVKGCVVNIRLSGNCIGGNIFKAVIKGRLGEEKIRLRDEMSDSRLNPQLFIERS
ncbi:hypothetical protein F2Q70_00028486 [Brassica cretica]|uniref:Uncharacterized protein n=1 Tax=Brassica cretica TaxID=69181 RepID=A0A8S9LHP8_BRACR|nr:hypothetical protein F2Q68_00028058 [Brassica cretica]KAF2605609.1 hypothetical protein F2Q70_00028486 [Brassica cretica]